MLGVLHNKEKNAMSVYGWCDPRFYWVKQVFEQHFDEGRAVGAAVSFTLNGEKVVDLWGGYADKKKHKLWEEDTMPVIYSCTEGMTSLCCHMLADQGLVDYKDLVAEYWPEFGQNGKENITLQCLLGHRCGVIGPNEPLDFEKAVGKPPEDTEEFSKWEARRWDYVCDILVKSKPWWTPGEHQEYHMTTFGYLVGEVVRRVTNQTVGQYFAQHVSQPIGADVYIGVPQSEFSRCAVMHHGPKAMEKFMKGAVNSQTWKQIEVPSANGFATARGLARVYAFLANGGELDGIHLISKDTIEKMRNCQSSENEKDTCLSIKEDISSLVWGMGYRMNSYKAAGPNPNAFGYGETGDDDRSKSLVDAFYACL